MKCGDEDVAREILTVTDVIIFSETVGRDGKSVSSFSSLASSNTHVSFAHNRQYAVP